MTAGVAVNQIHICAGFVVVDMAVFAGDVEVFVPICLGEEFSAVKAFLAYFASKHRIPRLLLHLVSTLLVEVASAAVAFLHGFVGHDGFFAKFAYVPCFFGGGCFALLLLLFERLLLCLLVLF